MNFFSIKISCWLELWLIGKSHDANYITIYKKIKPLKAAISAAFRGMLKQIKPFSCWYFEEHDREPYQR